LLGPLAASYALHLAVHLTATLSLFEILRRAVTLRAAFFAAFVFSLSPQLNSATGWDYTDGPGIAYMLLGIALLTGRPDARPRGLALAGAGAAIAAAVYTNLFCMAFTPAIAIYCCTLELAWKRGVMWRGIVRVARWAGAGAAALTGALCIVNHRLDGLWWFYEPSFRAAKELLGKENFWYHGLFGVAGLEPWLWYPAIALAFAVAEIVRSVRRLGDPRALLRVGVAVAYLAALAAMCFTQFVRKQPVLGLSFYADYILPFAFLVICFALWDAAESLTTRQFAATCAAAVAVNAVIWADWSGSFTPIWPVRQMEVAIAGGVLLAAGWAMRSRRLAVPLLLAGFALFTSELRFASGMWPKDSEPNPRPRGPHEYREVFERVIRMSDRIDQLRVGRKPLFWYDENEPNRSEYWAINGMYMFVNNRIGGNLPKDSCGKEMEPESILVMLTTRPALLAEARDKLSTCWAAQGLRPVPAEPDSQWTYIAPYTMSLLRAEKVR
jgi:hypothetical protein